MREIAFALEYELGCNGVADALAAVREAFLTSDYYADCLATGACGATQTTRVLDSTADTLVLYST